MNNRKKGLMNERGSLPHLTLAGVSFRADCIVTLISAKGISAGFNLLGISDLHYTVLAGNGGEQHPFQEIHAVMVLSKPQLRILNTLLMTSCLCSHLQYKKPI